MFAEDYNNIMNYYNNYSIMTLYLTVLFFTVINVAITYRVDVEYVTSLLARCRG